MRTVTFNYRPGWQAPQNATWQKVELSELDTLANYVIKPATTAGGEELFNNHCSSCHGERIPAAQDVSQARQIIASGGPHETMPVWGNVLTSEQMTALTNYTLELAKGTPIEMGQQLFGQNCTSCHGDLGEGGPNPTRAGDIIAPISTAEFLKTRDDFTLKAIISQGQPNFGMSPFGISNGGPLDDDEIDAIVAFMRSWEANPPVELPPEVAIAQAPLSADEVFDNICAKCHGPNGEGGIGPSLIDPTFQSSTTDKAIFDSVKLGHPATPMIGWSDVLSDDQIQQVVAYIRELGQKQPEKPRQLDNPGSQQITRQPTNNPQPPEQSALPSVKPTFVADILPIFESKCVMCHGSLGGWDASSYEKVMTTGDHRQLSFREIEGSILLGCHTGHANLRDNHAWQQIPDAKSGNPGLDCRRRARIVTRIDYGFASSQIGFLLRNLSGEN
jgi:mono/diheme cytochrome c family protein